MFANSQTWNENKIEDSNDSFVLLFVDIFDLDGVSSMALELTNLINDTID